MYQVFFSKPLLIVVHCYELRENIDKLLILVAIFVVKKTIIIHIDTPYLLTQKGNHQASNQVRKEKEIDKSSKQAIRELK